MQNRQDADVYVLVTGQRTGAGGEAVQLLFEGGHRFVGIMDTVGYHINPNATESIERDQLVKALRKGILKYIIHTDMVDQLDYQIHSVDRVEKEVLDDDLWDYWVFNLGGNAWLNGEATFKNMDLSGRFSATRITNDHKLEFSSTYNYSENTFTLNDRESISSIFKSYNFYLEYVKSLSDHWSIGGKSRSGSTTFGNMDVSTTLQGGVEFNVFPYADAQTRRFSFFYTIGPEHYDYTDLTIYNKQEEWLGRQALTIQYEQTQKWGEVYLRFGAQQYLHDRTLYNAFFNPRVNWQIYKGLSLDLGGYFSFVKDRINIAKSNVSDEDILLQVRQLDTQFSYYSFLGLNYRFGSAYNNFVNPRF